MLTSLRIQNFKAWKDSGDIRLAPLTATERKELGFRSALEGALVSEVLDDSPASEKGIQPGDVIVAVSQEAVSSPADVVDRVEKAKSKTKAVKTDYEKLQEDYERLLEKANSLLLENFELRQNTRIF